MTNEEVKKKAEEACCEIVDFIRGTMHNEEERNHLYIELACSFITLTCDLEKDLTDIEKQIRERIQDIYGISLIGVTRYKSGNESRVIRSFED